MTSTQNKGLLKVTFSSKYAVREKNMKSENQFLLGECHRENDCLMLSTCSAIKEKKDKMAELCVRAHQTWRC